MIARFALFCLGLCLALGAAMPGAAEDRLEGVVEAQLLPGWRMSDGTHMTALELRLQPGWKTYWRAPGDLGIPPQFDWRGSRNLSGVEIHWPTPRPMQQDGMITIGYSDRVILPLKVLPRRAGRDIRLTGALELGVCRDVCIPVHLDVSETLSRIKTRRDPRIAAALADRPRTEAEARVGRVSCTLTRDPREGLRLRAEITMPSAGGRELAVVETDNPQVWVAPAVTRRQGGMLVAETRLVHVEGRSFAVNRSALRFTVLGRSHAVDIQGCTAG